MSERSDCRPQQYIGRQQLQLVVGREIMHLIVAKNSIINALKLILYNAGYFCLPRPESVIDEGSDGVAVYSRGATPLKQSGVSAI